MKVDYRANSNTLASLSASSFYFLDSFAQQIQKDARVWVRFFFSKQWRRKLHEILLMLTMQVAHMFLAPYERLNQPTVFHQALIYFCADLLFKSFFLCKLAWPWHGHICVEGVLADGMCPIFLTQRNETRLRFSDLQSRLMAKDRKPTRSEGIFPLFKDNEITMYSMYH